MSPVSRRVVLAGAALTTASLLVPITVRGSGAQHDERYEITDWIVIAPSGEVPLALSQPEVGQGSYTAVPQSLADELDADWGRVKIRFVTGKAAYKVAFRQEPPAQKEGASMSTTALYERLRTAGAAARDVLTRAAAQRWNVDVAQCRTEKGFVINARGERLSYGQLAAAAAKLPLSATPPLKQRSQFHLIGKPLARLDTPAKCNGSAVFGIDVVVPGMLNAAIKTARSFTGQVTAVNNEADILKMPGVHAVVKLPALAIANEDAGAQHPQMPHLPRHNAVCVVADQFWQAKRALDALDVVFDRGPAGDLSTAKIDAMLEAGLKRRARRHRADQRAAARNPAASRGRGHRAALRAAAHRACSARAGQRHRELQRRRGRGLGVDPIGHGVPGGGGARRRLLGRRRQGQRHVPGRKLRPQDRARLCAATGAGVESGGTSGQAHSLARGRHAARRLRSEERRVGK